VIEIRPERPGDEAAIAAVTGAAFAPMPYSSGTEAAIIAGLRADDDLALSLVAVQAGAIVGHVAFSAVAVEEGGEGWFGLGPVSVRPDRQREGVGSALIERGLATLRARGAAGCVLIGDPAYYQRFGFRSDGQLRYGDVPPALVQWLGFGDAVPRGLLRYRPAFER
jgi:putative acetyltransferase